MNDYSQQCKESLCWALKTCCCHDQMITLLSYWECKYTPNGKVALDSATPPLSIQSHLNHHLSKSFIFHIIFQSLLLLHFLHLDLRIIKQSFLHFQSITKVHYIIVDIKLNNHYLTISNFNNYLLFLIYLFIYLIFLFLFLS